MELTEKIETINTQLVDLFGIDTITGMAIWRVVWSDDQREKRLSVFTEAGIELIYPVVMELPKYAYIKERYVLERLVVVPEINQDEIPASKLSYEPIWVFRDKDGNYLPPKLAAAKFVVDTVYAAMGKTSLAKYKDTEENTTEEGRQQRVDKLQEELYGDETDTCDALRYKEGIVVPSNFVKES